MPDDDFFFTEREAGSLPRTGEDLDESVWGGIVALVRSHLGRHSFARSFPVNCFDAGRGVIATDEDGFWLALRSNVPDSPSRFSIHDVPDAPVAMDIVEFLALHVAEATEADFHEYPRHRHLHFNDVRGLATLRKEVNRIFRRGGLAFEIDDRGRVHRLSPPVVRERVAEPLPPTGRESLDERLARAIEKYRSPDPVERREALEKLWDAWEEIKTLHGNKRAGIERLLRQSATHERYLAALEADAMAITKIGNEFQIRHSETDRVALESASQVDYLFGRLFNMIWLLLVARPADAGAAGGGFGGAADSR